MHAKRHRTCTGTFPTRSKKKAYDLTYWMAMLLRLVHMSAVDVFGKNGSSIAVLNCECVKRIELNFPVFPLRAWSVEAQRCVWSAR